MVTVAPGFLSVEKAGAPPARRQQLREVVLALRGLLGQGQAMYGGRHLELYHRPAAGSRVIVLASGPKMLELAGEVADGVMMLVGLHPSSVQAAREHVRRGALRAGRDPQDLEEVLIVPFGLGDQSQVHAWPRSWFRDGQPWMRYPSASNLHWLQYAGINLAPDYKPEDVGEDLARRICDAYGLFGTPQHCAERLVQARDATGISHVFLFPAHSWQTTYELPRAEADAFEKVIGPALRSA